MKKVYQLLNMERVTGDFGVEIEAEGQDMRPTNSAYWVSEDDGSLRGHYPESRHEFVLKKPLSKADVVKALNDLIADQRGATFDFSFRTSSHVHMNVHDLTEAQVCNVIYTYLLLEEPLVNFCGPDRKGNRFCLRVGDAEGVLTYIDTIYRHGLRRALDFNGNEIRYSALNLAALGKYGSLEFRAMRGTLEIDVLNSWITALYNVREFAKRMDSPKAILDLYQRKEAKEFMKEVLKEVYDDFCYPRMVKDIQRSFSLSLDLPYAFVPPKEEKPKEVKIVMQNEAVIQRPKARQIAVEDLF